MTILDIADSETVLSGIEEIAALLETQDWGTDEPRYNEALSLLDAFKQKIVELSPDEDEEDDGDDEPEPEPIIA